MKPLDISFSDGGPHFYLRSPNRNDSLALVVSAIGLICAGWLVVVVWTQTKSLHELESAMQRSARDWAARQPEKKPLAVTMSAERLESLNSAIVKLNVPWRDLFDAIEQVTPKDVALISLGQSGDKHSLTLVAEAANSDAMLDYLDALKKQPLLTGVTLIKHEINTADSNSPFRFQMEIQWQVPSS